MVHGLIENLLMGQEIKGFHGWSPMPYAAVIRCSSA
jgi:hypothetical protein